MVTESINKSFILNLRRETGEFQVYLSFLSIDNISEASDNILTGKSDRDYYESVHNDNKKKEFLAGRSAVVHSLFLAGYPKDSITINRGVFGSPYIAGLYSNLPEVSIAHSHGVAVALVFPAGQQLAIDLEKINCDKISRMKAIRSVLTNEELKGIADDPEMSAIPLYTLWSQKEALSKVLKCGLTVPFSVLETITPVVHGEWSEALFRNFFQYRVVSFLFQRKFVFSMVLPRKTEILNLEDVLSN